jgi:hypothetical protein
MQILHDHANNGRALRIGSYYINELLGWLDFKPLSKVIAGSLAGPNTLFKRGLYAGMRLVGLVTNLVYKIRN